MIVWDAPRTDQLPAGCSPVLCCGLCSARLIAARQKIVKFMLCDRCPWPVANVRDASTWPKNCIHFSICACHPCAGAMLVFSVSFQF